MNNYLFRFGNPYGGIHEDFHIVTNKTAEEIDKGFRLVTKTLGFNILELCSEYEEPYIVAEDIKVINKFGIFKETDLQESIDEYLKEDYKYYDYYLDNGSEDLISIFFAALKVIAYPDFEWSYRDLQEQILYCLDEGGCGFY